MIGPYLNDSSSSKDPVSLKRVFRWGLRLLSLTLICLSALLANRELTAFRTARQRFPPGSLVAETPVGGLDRGLAVRRLREVYLRPVELRYGQAAIHLDPDEAGFRLDESAMLAEALPPEADPHFWEAFWAYLWGRRPGPVQIPLQASASDERLRAYLQAEIVSRYDRSPLAARPIPGGTAFLPGATGITLDVEAALPPIRAALHSPDGRQVDLPLQAVAAGRPPIEHLQILLGQLLAGSGYDGLIDLYLQDLSSEAELNFASRARQDLPARPGIAFTASSTIKIPILISVFRRLDEPPDEIVDGWLWAMFAQSSNDAADALLRSVIDEGRGPLVVTEDLQALGLQNTFLAGYFTPGAPLLAIYETPANRRADVNTQPDPYNQADPAEIGRLLGMLHRCAQEGRGPLTETFSGQITQAECVLMLKYLGEDIQPILLKAGLPDGTRIIHKHGYGSAYDISDAALVFSPGGDYVLVVFLNDPDGLLFDPANELMARLSEAVYNYFNLPPPQSGP